MADKKISALTASTTPLAGTEVLPIVQGGSTVKVSVANLTAGRTVSAASLDVVSAGNPLITLRGTDGAYSSIFNIQAAGGGISLINATGGSNILSLYTNTVERFRIGSTGDATMVNGNIVIGTANKGIDFSANTNAPGMTSEVLNWYETGTWTGTLTAATPPTTPITKTGRYTRVGNQITVAIEFDNVDTTGASGAMEVTGLPFAAVSAGYGPVMKSGIGTQVIMAGIYGGLSKVIFSDAGTMSTTSIVAGAGVYLRFSATYYV